MDHCKECAKLEQDCCSGKGYVGAFVTLHDIKRIMKNTGLEASEFSYFGVDPLLDPDKDNLEWTNLHIESKGKIHSFSQKNKMLMLKLKKGKRNKCIFLTVNGCSVFDARPLFCRIYPFWFRNTRKGIELFAMSNSTANDHCLVCSNMKDDKHGMEIMGETRRDLVKCARQMLKEVKIYNKYKAELFQGLNIDEAVKYV